MDQPKPEPVVFETYLEAHQAASRRRANDATNGLVSKVVRSPYGGYTIRSWPVELLADPELWLATARNDRPMYGDCNVAAVIKELAKP